MLKKLSSIPFCSTKEQDEKLNAVISIVVLIAKTEAMNANKVFLIIRL